MTKRVKLADIAREAGVSLTAASFYINGKAKRYKLSAATCKRLEAAIRKYDFVPNLFARAMQQNRTFLVGLLVRDRINSSFWSDIIAGIEFGIAASGCHLVLATSHTDADGELEAIRQMRAKGVDACVISPVINADGSFPNLEQLQTLHASCPVIGLNVNLPGIPSVYNDDAAGGEKAARCFFDHGHRRVALLADGVLFSLPRFRAFEAFYAEQGIVPLRFSSPAEALARHGEFTAVFCGNDYLAAALCCNAAAAGIRVPDSFSVIGYDGLDWLQLLSPRPGTIIQRKHEVGEAIAAQLLRAFDAGECESVRFEPELSCGDTVGDAPAVADQR